MKIVVLANAGQKDELMAQQNVVPSNLVWRTEPDVPDDIRGDDTCIDLLFDNTPDRLRKWQQLNPSLLVINAVSAVPGVAMFPHVCINGWNTFLKRSVIEATAPEDLKEKTTALFSLFNKKIEWTSGIPGFLSLRIVASIINEAYFALEQQVSTKEEIDTAMRLGTNYPYGPFEWSREIGIKNIYNLLKNLGEEEKRYQPAALLKQEAGN
ncbi:MAG TPA: 3-hydroxyacyl-CoA dehydrogenase family protein [Chitinophagaceae bacterium]|nr:3-hydroxyacyl-CoA dehydrogenase family protein [Chitinophagaceae bacterium]